MKHLFLLLLATLLISVPGFAQTGIGTTTPHPFAALDISDTGRGILIPRMDSTHRKNIPNTKGLMVYDTTTNSLWQNTGTSWVNMIGNLSGAALGDMQYWNGNSWVLVQGGSYGQPLVYCNGVPTWGGCPVLLTTKPVTSITASAATSGLTVTNDGGSAITQMGICWSASPSPTTADTKAIYGAGAIGSFNLNLTGLALNTTYYVRAYATNTAGTAYGNELSFTTLNGIPVLSTISAQAPTANRATLTGNISSTGGISPTTRGFCWSTSPAPTIALPTKSNDGSGTGTYTSNIAGLTGSTTYYVRSYATNSLGTVYGNEITFTTGIYTYGQSAFGGIIIYVDSTAQHGYVMTATDLSTGIGWSNGSNIVTGATGHALGDGLANTTTIVTAQGAGSYAAALCDTLTLNGYSDWYLPNSSEINNIATNSVSGFLGLASFTNYWTSEEVSASTVYAFFSSQSAASTPQSKSSSYRVRAIRAF